MDTNPLDKFRGAGYNQAKTINSQPPSDAPQDTQPVQPVTPPSSSQPAIDPPPVIEPLPSVSPPAEPQMPADAPADSPPSQPPQLPPFPPQQPTEPEEKPSEPTEQKPDQPDPKPNTVDDNPLPPESRGEPAAQQNPLQPTEKQTQKDSKLPEVKVKLDLAFLKAKYVVLFLAIATGIAGSALAIYSYQKLNSSNTLGAQVIADSERLSEKEIKALKDKVSQIAVLPEDEIPVVLPITDLTKLHSNEFFKDAKLKDKILIFKQAGKIILYDPINNKIVNIGPYSETPAGLTPSPTPIPTPSPTPEATSSSKLKKR